MSNHRTSFVHYKSYDRDQTQFDYEFLQARTQRGFLVMIDYFKSQLLFKQCNVGGFITIKTPRIKFTGISYKMYTYHLRNSSDNDIVRASQLIALEGKFPVHAVDLYISFCGADGYCIDFVGCFIHADFHVPLMVARTTCWTNTRVTSELRFHGNCLWFIHFNRSTCMWHGTEIVSYQSTHWGRNSHG